MTREEAACLIANAIVPVRQTQFGPDLRLNERNKFAEAVLALTGQQPRADCNHEPSGNGGCLYYHCRNFSPHAPAASERRSGKDRRSSKKGNCCACGRHDGKGVNKCGGISDDARKWTDRRAAPTPQPGAVGREEFNAWWREQVAADVTFNQPTEVAWHIWQAARACQCQEPLCGFPSVLCEFHGGHDGCAVDLMQTQAALAAANKRVEAVEKVARYATHGYGCDARQDFTGECSCGLREARRALDAIATTPTPESEAK